MTGLVPVLLTAWTCYAVCQGDPVLPVVAAVLALAAAARKRWVGSTGRSLPPKLTDHHPHGPATPSVPSPHPPGRLALALGAVVCLAGGWLWRRLISPPPATAYRSFVYWLDALQPAMLLAACALVLFGGSGVRQRRLLWHLSWATVAVSANVPVSPAVLLALALFCVANLVVITGGWWRSGHQQPGSVRAIAGGLAVFVVGWGASLVASGLLTTAVNGVVNRLFFTATSPVEQLLPPRINAIHLSLGGPPPAGRGRRPVLEIDGRGSERLYLRTQVFPRYRNGAWRATVSGETEPLPGSASGDATERTLVLLSELGEVVPAPAGVVACSGRIERDRLGLLRWAGAVRSRKLVISDDAGARLPSPRDEELVELLAVPDSLQPLLGRLLAEIAGDAVEPVVLARRIRDYFHREYQYSLRPDLPRGEEALRLFLSERRDAYCVYFASAATLLLRQGGIPARVVGGFVAQERDGEESTRLVARVRDAHAWSEAFLPTEAGGGCWIRIDATPQQARYEAIHTELGLLRTVADRLWRWFCRWRYEPGSGRVLVVLRTVVPWLAAVALLPVALGAIRRWRRRRRRGSDTRDRHRQSLVHPLNDRYRRFEDAMVAAAGPRPASETDAELLLRLQQVPQLPQPLPALASAFVDRYRIARFGRSGQETGDADQILDKIEAAMAAAAQPDGDSKRAEER